MLTFVERFDTALGGMIEALMVRVKKEGNVFDEPLVNG
jgi:hypothetical protein